MLEQIEADLITGGNLNSHFTGLPQNAGNASVGILDIKNRVFVGLLHSQVKIKIEMALRAAVQEEETRRVLAHLFHQLFHGDELAGPFRHFNLLSVPEQGYVLEDEDFQGVPAVT